MFEAKGLITPVLTALDENEKFNPTAYKDFINMLIEAGVHGIFPLGTNGEFYAFNNEEKYEIIKTVKKLMEFENIIGIKDSSGNFDNTLKYIENTNSRINVLAGSDSLILWTLMAGGTGAISGCSNVFPELMVSIYNYFIKGDIEKANEAQKKIRPFRNVMQMGNPNSVVKLAANLRGLNVGPARRPSNCTDPKIIEALKEVFKQY